MRDSEDQHQSKRGEAERDGKIWAIVPAAGVGRRMMADLPKQYLPLARRRVLDHALRALCRHDAVAGVVVGIRDGDRWWRAQPFAHDKLIAVSRGGDDRARTVRNALAWILEHGVAADDDWAMVHDAARPCLRAADIERVAAAARAHGDGAALALALTDTLKRASGDGGDGVIEATLECDSCWRALTPQMFRCAPLHDALRDALQHGVAPRDESAAMERVGVRPALVEGHPANIKITAPADLELAALYLAGAVE
ncbi:MAG: 2-C-methyl-D-erythritol 4-phosphate cytidylyltransferase [bacterium]